ncbi:MAG TPA: MOSC domain-containing protein [Acidimicrobiia bacterium]|nr:MOSC domain-containing protein [Acidimicrobiia bacterium]
MEQSSTAELDTGLELIRQSPADAGPIELIVRRLETEVREALDRAELAVGAGLVGDCWPTRASSSTADDGPDPAKQVTLISSRLIALLAGEPERWALAGDQIYVDLDLSFANLPAGTRLALGTAVVDVTEAPHLGCAKFRRRFGADALRFVNSPSGRELRLRGVNTAVMSPGVVHRGDTITRIT